MKKLFLSCLVVLFFSPTLLFAQQSSVQLKLISTEDMYKMRSGDKIVNYKVGVFYQQQLTKRFHWIVGAQGNRVNNKPDVYGCPVGESYIYEKGINLNPSLGIKYYAVEKSVYNLFAGFNTIGQFSNTNGRLRDWLESDYQTTFDAQTYGLGLEPNLGLELNIHPKFFLQTMVGLTFSINQINRNLTREQPASTYSTSVNYGWFQTPNIGLRIGYRF